MGRWPEEDVKSKKYDPRVHPFRLEADFQDWLMRVAKRLGYNAYHTYRSRRSEPGYPDTTICGKGRLIYAELKTWQYPTNPGPHQKRWLDALAMVRDANLAAGLLETPEVYLWRADHATINEILEILK